MIVHVRTNEAQRAGRVYLVLTLAGEMGMFAGVVAIASVHGNVPLNQLAGLCQVRIKVALAYSIISRMGLVLATFGAPLAHTERSCVPAHPGWILLVLVGLSVPCRGSGRWTSA